MKYQSKYPEIIVDKDQNSPNMHPVVLSVEQLYDLMHHTHKLSDLISDGGDKPGQDEDQTPVQQLTTKVESLSAVVETVNTEIASINSEIEELKVASESTMSITDWDVTKPGIQDIDGNTIEDDGAGVTAVEL